MIRRFLCGLGIATLVYLAPAIGYWQSRDSGYNVSVGGSPPAYTGPLDLGIAGIQIAWSLRCSSTSYTGNVADIWDAATGSTTETLLTCSAGGTINETINALSVTCAIACRIKVWYDQSGQNKCAGSTACDLVNITNANRPTISTNCINGHACFQCDGAAKWLQNTVQLTGAQAQPYTITTFGEQTAGFTSNGTLFGAQTQTPQVGYGNATDTAFLFAGTAAPTATASNSAFHSISYTFNGASSEIYVDGSGTSVSTGTGAIPSGQNLVVCASTITNVNELTGSATEILIWSGALSSGNKSSLNTNQTTYW